MRSVNRSYPSILSVPDLFVFDLLRGLSRSPSLRALVRTSLRFSSFSRSCNNQSYLPADLVCLGPFNDWMINTYIRLMEKEQLINFIKKNIPNITVMQNGLETIADYFEELEFSKNECLLKPGKISGYYYLAEGFVRAFTHDTDGNEITTFFYPKDRVAFEAASFFLHQPSTEYLQAITDCKVYATSFEKLNMLFHSVPEFREFARAMLLKEFVAYRQRTLAMINKSGEERYAQLVADNNKIFKYAQLKQVASYLGITDTSLSRIRAAYAKK